MASILQVEELRGPTSGANANKVIIPSGQTLDASAGGIELPAGVGGKLLQITHVADGTNITTSSTSMIQVGINHSITTTADNSKLWVIFDGNVASDSNNNFLWGRVQSTISGSSAQSLGTEFFYSSYDDSTNQRRIDRFTVQRLHEPNVSAGTTITYDLAGQVIDGESYEFNGWRHDGAWNTSTHITIMEIAG